MLVLDNISHKYYPRPKGCCRKGYLFSKDSSSLHGYKLLGLRKNLWGK